MASSQTTNQEEADLSSTSQGLSGESTKASESRDKRRPKQQQRQLLSCSKCRERKVKCDRTKPCSACCARGHPRECHFVLTEGSSFGPIQQSLELRKLRRENVRLKEQVLEGRSRPPTESDEENPSAGPSLHPLKSAQRKLGLEEPGESIYFGNPGMASIVNDISAAASSKKTLNLTHPIRGTSNLLLSEVPTVYPFPTIWTTSNWLEGLRRCLEPEEDILDLLDSYIEREDAILTPRLTFGLGREEVELFLLRFEQNATSHPDVLALVFAILATEIQRKKYDPRDQDVEMDERSDDMKGQMFLSASMQALRQSSFAGQPTMRNVQTMTLITMYLANSGRALDAWTLLGTTIRNAQAIGLHRNPKMIEPLPSLRDSALRKKLWWYLLFIDQQFSMILGRPMGISAVGDCPFSEQLTTDAAVLRLLECIDQITVLGRQIMGTTPLASHRISNYCEKLNMVLDMLPEEVRFKSSWITNPAERPDSPLDQHSAVVYSNVHSYLIILNRQRVDTSLGSSTTSFGSIGTTANQSSLEGALSSPSFTSTSTWSSITASSALILDVFRYLHSQSSPSLVDWSVKQHVFTAVSLLLVDATARHKVDHEHSIETAVAIFHDLAETQHDELGRRAFDKLSDGLHQMRAAEQRRRSSTTTASFPEYSLTAQDIRRDSQISAAAAQQYNRGNPEHDLKSPRTVDGSMGNTTPYRNRPDAAYDQFSKPEITPTQQRRASVTYGSIYPDVQAGMITRPMTGMSAPSAFVAPVQQAPVSYRHSMHIGALPPQVHMTSPLAPGHMYAPGMIPLQPGQPIAMEMHHQGMPQQMQMSQMEPPHPHRFMAQPPQQMQYANQQTMYPPQQAPPGYYQSQPDGPGYLQANSPSTLSAPQAAQSEMAENIYDEIEIEDMTWDDTLQIYHYPCPCGDRFEIGLADLRDGEEIAVCPSCSLMIRVIFDEGDLPGEEKRDGAMGQGVEVGS
ncbi:Diphthamide biosynthesis protein 3 [Elsinoe fawcettii]|nr:Diphthamide biosynthesis protein 3 [Elsinoe fawcettii]